MFKFGKRSLTNLAGVHKDLVQVAEKGIALSDIDFSVIEGVRTVETQRIYVAKGASKTMNSRHLTGHAIDVVALIGNKVRYDFDLYYSVARAMQEAARFYKTPLRWGACWVRIDSTARRLEDLVTEYVQNCQATGKRPLLDAAHFELPQSHYP